MLIFRDVLVLRFVLFFKGGQFRTEGFERLGNKWRFQLRPSTGK